MDEHAASTPDVNRLADHNVIAALADVTTAGGLVGAFGHMWDAQYRDMMREGRTLVGVHTDDRDRADRAYALLQQFTPVHLAHFDAEGALLHEAAAPGS